MQRFEQRRISTQELRHGQTKVHFYLVGNAKCKIFDKLIGKVHRFFIKILHLALPKRYDFCPEYIFCNIFCLTRKKKCEETQLEDVDLNGISEEIEDVSIQIQKLSELSEPVIEEYRALSKTTDTDEYIEGIGSKIEELQSDMKSFERRVQLMSSNKGMVFLNHDLWFISSSNSKLSPVLYLLYRKNSSAKYVGTIISLAK